MSAPSEADVGNPTVLPDWLKSNQQARTELCAPPLREAGWSQREDGLSAETGVKVSSPEIVDVAQGRGFHFLEASTAARGKGEGGFYQFAISDGQLPIEI